MNYRITAVFGLTLIYSVLLSNSIELSTVNLFNLAIAQASTLEPNKPDIMQRLDKLEHQDKIMVRSQFVVNPEQIDEFIEQASEIAAFTNGKDDPIFYRFFQNIEQSNHFVLVEEWANRDAIAQQKNTIHARKFQNQVAKLTNKPSKVRIYQPATQPTPEDGKVDRALVEAQPGATPTISKTRDRLAQHDLIEAPFVLLVDVPVKSGGAATMKNTAVRVQEATLEEPGSVRYGYYQNVEQPTSFLLFEWWREFNDMAEHVELPHFQELMKTFGAVGGNERTVALYKPLSLP